MIDTHSLQTFSGLFVFLALIAVLNGWHTLGGLLLTVAGAAGLGVFWERWSRLTGYEVQVRALWHPVRPTGGEAWLFATHVTMLALGASLLLWASWRRTEGSRS
jgi:hypothetical protein